MGTFELNDYENLGWCFIPLKCFEMTFWRWIWPLNVTMTWLKKLMVGRTRYHSNFIVQPQYLNWVGLNWKFAYLSMGSLQTSAIGVMLIAASSKNEMKWKSYLKCLCSSRDGGLPLLGGQAHRGGAYTRVYKWKVMVDCPHTVYVESGLSWRMHRMLWWKCTTSAEGRNYSNSRVRGHGRLERPYDSVVRGFQNERWFEWWLWICETWHLGSHLSNLDN